MRQLVAVVAQMQPKHPTVPLHVLFQADASRCAVLCCHVLCRLGMTRLNVYGKQAPFVPLHCTRVLRDFPHHPSLCFLSASTDSRQQILPHLFPLCLLLYFCAAAAGMTGLYQIRKFLPTLTPTDTGAPHLT
jgi:hypothetical protein